MPFLSDNITPENWIVEKIGVIGPGIVGMPMAALLAHSKIKIGSSKPAEVVVIQRNSKFSGWKVNAINSGKSTIGGIEPGLDEIVEISVKEKLLRASFNYEELIDADVILVCVQTDKKEFEPDYGPLLESLKNICSILQFKPEEKKPLIIFESTLAPSTMATIIKELFAQYNLIEGKDIFLGNSPNRVMPGRLVERVTNSDKIIAGLNPVTPELIHKLYSNIVTKGNLLKTNSLTAEVVKTFENAYRDVRIAFSAEVVRYCDEKNINFYALREEVNNKLSQQDNASNDPASVPSGGLLIPTVGVGGHCLPKDGILLWWRKIEKGFDTSLSLIINARKINDSSPEYVIKHSEKSFGNISNKKIALLGAAYRFNSEDTRNSPALTLAAELKAMGCKVILHDPFVKNDDQNILKYNLEKNFTNNIEEIYDSDFAYICTAHQYYIDEKEKIISNSNLKGLYDACNIFSADDFAGSSFIFTGIGKGKEYPEKEFINYIYESFKLIERGTANELNSIIEFLNEHYADTNFNKIIFNDVQKLAGTCSTGCIIDDFGPVQHLKTYNDFYSLLTKCAEKSEPISV